MKPEVLKRLREFPTNVVTDFDIHSRTARAMLSHPHMKESQVNAKRLAILKQLKKPRGKKDMDRAFASLRACPELCNHLNSVYRDFGRSGGDVDVLEGLLVPYVYVPPPEYAVILVCRGNNIPIEKGDTDFNKICSLMLEELGDERAGEKEARKAFRFKLVEQWKRLMSRKFLASGELYLDIRHVLKDTDENYAELFGRVPKSIKKK